MELSGHARRPHAVCCSTPGAEAVENAVRRLVRPPAPVLLVRFFNHGLPRPVTTGAHHMPYSTFRPLRRRFGLVSAAHPTATIYRRTAAGEASAPRSSAVHPARDRGGERVATTIELDPGEGGQSARQASRPDRESPGTTASAFVGRDPVRFAAPAMVRYPGDEGDRPRT